MFDAMDKIQKLSDGEIVEMSISQIVFTLVNMSDAKKNLSPSEFEVVYDIFKIYMNDTEKKKMDMYLYIETCKVIINSFDVCVDFRQYSGRDKDDIEFEIFLEEIRDEYEKQRCMDERYVLVKKALEDTKNKCHKIIYEEFFKEDESLNEEEKLEKSIKRYSGVLRRYILKNLDDEDKNKFKSLINNSKEICQLTNCDKSYFDTYGFDAAIILSFLYYIDGIDEDKEKCMALNKFQREIHVDGIKKAYEKHKMDEIFRKYKLDPPNSNSGCGFVLIFAIVSMLVLGVSKLI